MILFKIHTIKIVSNYSKIISCDHFRSNSSFRDRKTNVTKLRFLNEGNVAVQLAIWVHVVGLPREVLGVEFTHDQFPPLFSLPPYFENFIYSWRNRTTVPRVAVSILHSHYENFRRFPRDPSRSNRIHVSLSPRCCLFPLTFLTRHSCFSQESQDILSCNFISRLLDTPVFLSSSVIYYLPRRATYEKIN